MQINLSGHHITITDSIRDYVTNRFKRLSRHFDHITQVQTILRVEKFRHTAETTLFVSGAEIFATAEADDLYAAIDALAHKLDRQLLKHKEKITAHHAKTGTR